MPATQYCNTYVTTNTTASTQYATITWPQWSNTGTSINTNYVVSNAQVWTSWVNQATTITVPNTYGYNDQVWLQWQQNVYVPQNMPQNGYYTTLSPEDEAARRQRIEAERQAQQHRFEERRIASVRARTLLESFLTDEQKTELERHGRFFVRGSRGRRYCIRANGQSGNVDLLAEDRSVVGRFCAHPRGYLPDPDAWLAQMLALQDDEDEFLRTANLHMGRRPELVVA